MPLFGRFYEEAPLDRRLYFAMVYPCINHRIQKRPPKRIIQRHPCNLGWNGCAPQMCARYSEYQGL